MKCILTYLSIWQFLEENTRKWQSQKQINMVFHLQQDYYSQNTLERSLHIQIVILNAESFLFGLGILIVPEDQI